MSSVNGKPAKLFRSGVLTLRDILLMNGYTYSDILGRNGKSLAVTLNGRRIILRGEPSVPAALTVNEQEAALSAIVHAGDSVSFVPARSGADAQRTLGELLPEFTGRVLVNNQDASPDTVLHSGDVILTLEHAVESRADDQAAAESRAWMTQAAVGTTPGVTDDQDAVRVMPSSGALEVELNGEPLSLPGKGQRPALLHDGPAAIFRSGSGSSGQAGAVWRSTERSAGSAMLQTAGPRDDLLCVKRKSVNRRSANRKAHP